MTDQLTEKLKSLSDSPGVYLMKDGTGLIIYVGKAKSLKKRVSSYFHKTDHDIKTTVLVKNIVDLEYIVTDSEIEALLLENTLIKTHLPKYNIRLKDDKRYPYIAVTLSEEYPRVIYTRSFRRNGDRYFGPYTDSLSARSTVELANKLFKLRICNKKLPLKDGERPCLNFQMKQCSGICTGAITREEYLALVQNVILFLEGNIDPIIQNLKKKMEEHAAKFEYEKSANFRDMIFSIQSISRKQKVYTPAGYDQDYIASTVRGDEAIVVLFEFRKGILLGRKVSVFQNARYETPADAIRSFLIEYYDREEIPQRVIIGIEIEDMEIIETYLSKKSGIAVKLCTPKSPEDTSVISLIEKNINVLFAEKEAFAQSPGESLARLQESLDLAMYPEKIVCFDISNIQGKHAVASMSAFTGGIPDKKQYRIYNIRGYEEANDPGMIHEAVARYLQNCVNGEWDLADLILIDGGPTQLTRAKEAAYALGVTTPIISIAKRFEEIYTDPKSEPLALDKNSPALKILQNLRDEAHRFGITRHRKKRDEAALISELESVDGIGEKKRNALLLHFGSMDAIKAATIAELESVKGVSHRDAENVWRFFNGE